MTPTLTPEEIAAAVHAAAGRRRGTRLFRGARVVNVITGEIERTHVLTAGRLIAGVGDEYGDAAADETLDLENRWLAPGLIDGHVHLESSLVSPAEYAKGVVPRGVTGVVCDPHELASVAGVEGIRWFLRATERLPLDVWVGIPSCVPSSSLETSGARLGVDEIRSLLGEPRVVAVAEIMDVAGVTGGRPDALAKVQLAEASGKIPEGHAPLVRGPQLQAYFAAGIASDHETTTAAEGLAKLRAGCFLMIREASTAHNLEALASLIVPHSDRIALVTDDRVPGDLLDDGGVDGVVRQAIRLGTDPIVAIRCASWTVARHFGLVRRGAIAPGYFADLGVLEDLQEFRVASVFKDGERVGERGSLLRPGGSACSVASDAMRRTVHLPALSEASFRLEAPTGAVRCITLVPGQLLTRQEWIDPLRSGTDILPDPARDIAKLVCIERHGRTGTIGCGLVRGFGLERGALASSVAHDHHNLLAVGTSDADLLVACRRVQELQGGLVAVDGHVRAELPLPIAGLMADWPLTAVRQRLSELERTARTLGVAIPAPFMTLSFLGLPVIDALRLTDQGLVDVAAARIVSIAG